MVTTGQTNITVNGEYLLWRFQVIITNKSLSKYTFKNPPLVKPSHRCNIKILKAQEAAMSLEINTMLSERIIEPGLDRGLTLPISYLNKSS